MISLHMDISPKYVIKTGVFRYEVMVEFQQCVLANENNDSTCIV